MRPFGETIQWVFFADGERRPDVWTGRVFHKFAGREIADKRPLEHGRSSLSAARASGAA